MSGLTSLMWAVLLLASICLALGAGELKSSVTSLQEVTSVLEELRRDNADLRRSLTERQTAPAGGATFVRWGRTTCPTRTELVYRGYMGSGHYKQKGAPTNNLCLPEEPQYLTPVRPRSYSSLYGTEYETPSIWPRNNNHDVPCAVCRTPGRSSALMIPARVRCPSGWRREYFGYLMGGYVGHEKGSEYACVDYRPQNAVAGSINHNGNLLYFVRGFCGALKCPGYQSGRVITCVVCSR